MQQASKTENNLPKVSIVTVTFNAGPLLEKTLGNLQMQDYPNKEIVVVDGKSTDDTIITIKRYAHSGTITTWVSEPDRGIYDAMNKGLKKATGRFVIFLNAGDKFHDANTLQLLADAAAANPDAQILYGQTNLVDSDGRYLCPRHLTAPANLTFRDFARGMLVCHQAFVVDRTIAPQYDLQYRLSADYEWCIRCLKASCRNVLIDQVLIDYLADGATTANRRRSLMERFRIMAHYYGLLPTVGRHLGFIGRFFRHQHRLKQSRNQ